MLSCLDKKIIRRIQEDIPLTPEPYKEIAMQLGISENELLDKLKEFSGNGTIRRYGSILNHINVGFRSNAMVVWDIAEDRICEVSKIMISYEQVSHCYQRPVMKGWPYNIFTMVHARNMQECKNMVKEIAVAVGIDKYEMLNTTDELKKVSMKYFIE